MPYVISNVPKFWQKTNAKTLTGAKIACTRKFNANRKTATFYVAEQTVDGQVELLTRKDNFPGSKWVK